MDFEKLKETIVNILEEVRNGLPKPVISPGMIVCPVGMTVLDKEDPHAEADFVASGRISITLLSSECLLLVLAKKGNQIRILALDSGQVGRVDVESVKLWR